MVNYQNGKIYKMVNNETNDFYVGSTTKKYLAHRKSGHHQDSKQEVRKSPLMQAIRTYGITTFSIILIEKYPCQDKDELCAREQYWIDQLKPTYNVFKALLTDEECKQYRAQYDKEYKATHKDKIREIQRKTREKNKEKRNAKAICECGASVSRYTLNRHMSSLKHLSTMETKSDNPAATSS